MLSDGVFVTGPADGTRPRPLGTDATTVAPTVLLSMLILRWSVPVLTRACT